MNKLFICDAQIHAPRIPGIPERPTGTTTICSFSRETLDREVRAARVSRVVIVPFPGGYNEECVRWAVEEPDRYAVMGVFLLDGTVRKDLVAGWKVPGMLGMRVSFWTAEHKAMFLEGRLNWLWKAAEEFGVPVTVNAMGVLPKMAKVAVDHPRLRITLDHMGLIVHQKYSDFSPLMAELLPLARHSNIAVKLSKLQGTVDEAYPFPSLHDPIRRVFDAFGPKRCFWGTRTIGLTIGQNLHIFSKDREAYVPELLGAPGQPQIVATP
ncbi:MAG: amidohydrolase family protein, partial [Chloroflexota bacterium]